MDTSEIARLFRAIADVIERNDPSEISDLTNALAEPLSRSRRKKPASGRKAREFKAFDFSPITQRVLDSTDRAAAKAVLEEENLTRRELTRLGQEHNVHITKADTVEVIQTKIVEALVGSRLSSRAIRGEN